MALGRRKRLNLQHESAKLLEARLDKMHATKDERELARGVFKQLYDGPDRPPLGTIVRRSVGAVVRGRRSSDDAPIKSEMA